jgi:cytochrome c553
MGTTPAEPSSAEPPTDGVCIAPSQETTAGLFSSHFEMQCAGCHGTYGEGNAEFPSLPGSATTLSAFSTVVRVGLTRDATHVMPAFHLDRYPAEALKADFELLQKHPVGDRSPRAAPRPGVSFAVNATPDAKEVFANGLRAWRKAGEKGACASCHGPMAVDLARIKFTDADILRRCFGQALSTSECLSIVDMIHTVRARFSMRHFCRKEDGFLQPGHAVLPGNTPVEKDLALVQEFERVGLPLFTKPVTTRADFEAVIKRFQELKPMSIRVALPLNRWTEDRFFGDAHLSSREWIPDYPSEPTADQRPAWYALHDAYIDAPTTDNLWRIYEQAPRLKPAPAYNGPDLVEMYEEMKRSSMPAADFLKQKTDLHKPLAPYTPGFLENNFTNYSRKKYQAVLIGQHMMIDNAIQLPRPPSYRTRAELSSTYAGIDYGASSIWMTGDMIISGCVSGCWEPKFFMADLSPSVAATTRFHLKDDSVYEDFARTASTWPFLATMLDFGEQQIRVTNEYYYGNFGTWNHAGFQMYLHQLWVRSLVSLGDLYLIDNTIPQRRGDRDYRSTFNPFDGPTMWLNGQVWANMGGAPGGHPQTNAYAKQFSQNMLRIALWSAADLCTGKNPRITNTTCPIGRGESAGRALHTCEVSQNNSAGFDYSLVADACQTIQRCVAACEPKR